MDRQHFLLSSILVFWSALVSPSLGAQQIDLFDQQATMDSAPPPVSENLEALDEFNDAGDLVVGEPSLGPAVEQLGTFQAAGPLLTLYFERSQGSILVPATVQGTSVYFVFDTGASYVTLEASFAARLGVTPGESAPESLVQTANGPASVRFGLLRSLKLGSRNHGSVTFAICPGCSQETYRGKPIAGLLGRNVLSRYRIQIDESRGVIELAPHSAFFDRLFDIRPWVGLVPTRNYERRGEWIMAVSVENSSPKVIRELVVRFRCGQKEYTSQPAVVRPGKTTSISVAVKHMCARWTADVERATW